MKSLIPLILILLLLLFSVYAEKPANFQGDWWFDGVLEDFGRCIFNLNLFQEGNKITGWYSSVAYNGNKIDYDPDEEQNISGIIKGNTAIITFKSYGWGGTGKAKITHKDDRIEWEIIAEKGYYWCPHKVILEKK